MNGDNNTSQTLRRGFDPGRFSTTALGLFLVALTTAVFCRTLRQDFVSWDDSMHVYSNPHVLSFALHPSLSVIESIWRAPYQALYIPVAYTFYAILAHIAYTNTLGALPDGGMSPIDPRIFHAANLIVHIVNVLLVFALIRKISHKNFAACLGASIFAIHPIQVESVAWISELRGLLSAMFGFWALLVYHDFLSNLTDEGVTKERTRLSLAPYRASMREITAIRQSRARVQRCKANPYSWGDFPHENDLIFIRIERKIFLGASLLVLGTMAMLCKPAAVVLFPIAWMVGRWGVGASRRLTAASLLLLAIPAGAVSVVTHIVQPTSGMIVSALWQRPFIAADAIAFYLEKLIIPVRLCIDYMRTPQYVMAHWWGYVDWILPASLLYAAWRLRHWSRDLWIGTVVFVVGLLPVLGFSPFIFQCYSTVADRYLYFSMFGIALIAADLLSRAPAKVLAYSAIPLVAFAALASFQLRTWDNAESLFKQAILVSPTSSQMHHDYGVTLTAEGKVAESKLEYRKALFYDPQNGYSEAELGRIAFEEGDLKEAERRDLLAVKYCPLASGAHCELGMLYVAQNRDNDAVVELKRAAQLDEIRTVRAHAMLAEIYQRKGMRNEAQSEAKIAFRLAPLDPTCSRRVAAFTAPPPKSGGRS
jgi:Tfp pilus assembly protein PilF